MNFLISATEQSTMGNDITISPRELAGKLVVAFAYKHLLFNLESPYPPIPNTLLPCTNSLCFYDTALDTPLVCYGTGLALRFYYTFAFSGGTSTISTALYSRQKIETGLFSSSTRLRLVLIYTLLYQRMLQSKRDDTILEKGIIIYPLKERIGVLPFVFAHERLEGNRALSGLDGINLAKQALAFFSLCFFDSECARIGYYAR